MALFAFLIAVSFSLGSRAAPHIDPGALNAVRFVFAVSLMGGLALRFTPRLTPRDLARPREVWRFLLLGALMGVYFVTMFTALTMTSPLSTGAIFTLVPLMGAGFAFFLVGQRARPSVLAGMALAAAAAIWVIFDGDLEAIRALKLGRGEAIFFAGCVCHAAYGPLVAKLKRPDEPMLAFTFWMLAGTGVCIAVFAFPKVLATHWTTLPAIVWIATAYLAIFTTAGTFFLMQYALTRIPAGKAFAYTYLTPVYIIVMEGLSGAGWASPSVAIGALAIVAALAMLQRTAD